MKNDLTLNDCIEHLTLDEINDPHNAVRLYALFVLSEIVSHHALIERLSDSRLRDFREILEKLDDPKPSVRKCSSLALRIVDDTESNHSDGPDADGSAIRRLREFENLIARTKSTGVKFASRRSSECPTS